MISHFAIGKLAKVNKNILYKTQKLSILYTFLFTNGFVCVILKEWWALKTAKTLILQNSIKVFYLPKRFGGIYGTQKVFVDLFSAVGIKQAVGVFAGLQIVPKRPGTPKKIHVAIPHPAVAKVNKATECEIV